MTRIRLGLMLYFFTVANKAACPTLSWSLYSYMVLSVLEMCLTKDSEFEDLLCGAPSCSGACLFFSDGLLRLPLQSVQHDLQHDFAWVAYEAVRSVLLALL